MKKMIAVVLVLTMVMAFANSAMAAYKRFDIVTESTSAFKTGCSRRPSQILCKPPKQGVK